MYEARKCPKTKTKTEKERTRRTRRASERDAVYFELFMDPHNPRYNCKVGEQSSVLAIVIQLKFELFDFFNSS